MTQEHWQKAKLLLLADMLRQETNEEHPLTTKQILDKLEEKGVPCERKVLAKDIAVLNAIGLEVLSVQVGKGKGYYVEDRTFSIPELKILIDAVQAASFTTGKKTEELISKIAALGGDHYAKLLTESVVHFNGSKHCNETVYYSIDAIQRALLQKKKISFRYFNLGPNKEHLYRRDGARYEVEPIALVYQRDNYYLGTLSPQHEGVVNYRIDRMETVEVLEDAISAEALRLRDNMGEYTKQTFKMYTGELETVVLEFDSSAMNSVWDNFGEDITMQVLGEDRIRTTVQVQISPPFWGWIFQFVGKVRIMSPSHVVAAYREQLIQQLGLMDG